METREGFGNWEFGSPEPTGGEYYPSSPQIRGTFDVQIPLWAKNLQSVAGGHLSLVTTEETPPIISRSWGWLKVPRTSCRGWTRLGPPVLVSSSIRGPKISSRIALTASMILFMDSGAMDAAFADGFSEFARALSSFVKSDPSGTFERYTFERLEQEDYE